MDEPEIIEPPESLLDGPAQPAPEASPEFPPTNLSDRFHQGQDPVASIRHRQAEQEQALTALMRRDHEARDLYWRGQQVEMDRAAHASRMRTEDEHFRHRRNRATVLSSRWVPFWKFIQPFLPRSWSVTLI